MARLRHLAVSSTLVAPVPRLVGVAVAVAAREGEREAELVRMALEPAECNGGFEPFLQRIAARRRDIDGATRVVLAVSRWRALAQDLVEARAFGQLLGQDFALPVEAAEGGGELQRHAFAR